MSKPRHRVEAGRSATWTLSLLVLAAAGCGTMRTSDTSRTATEQLLIAHSIDDSVSRLDFRLLAGKRVFFDAQYLEGLTDKGYLISSLRQQLLAGGCLLQEERKDATYVVEARAGSIGTDNNSMLIGVPQMSIPSVMPGIPGMMIPEIALAKKTNRRAVAKVAVFAYNRKNGEPVWQSGVVQAISRERNSWLCGAGPFQRGHLHRGTEFDDQQFVVPGLDRPANEPNYAVAGVADPAIWKSGPLPEGGEAPDKNKSIEKKKTSPAGYTLAQTPASASQEEASEKPE